MFGEVVHMTWRTRQRVGDLAVAKFMLARVNHAVTVRPSELLNEKAIRTARESVNRVDVVLRKFVIQRCQYVQGVKVDHGCWRKQILAKQVPFWAVRIDNDSRFLSKELCV